MDDNEYLALLAEGGFMVQKISTLLCPEGRKIPFDAVPEKAAADTVRALQADRVTLFKATLISNGKLARIDIMRKRGNEFHLIEVKATSFDSDEHAAAVAEGRPSVFRTKRVESIVAGWRDHLEDVAFQVLVPRELFPQATIQPYLLMPDTSKSTPIDRLHSLFRLHRRLVPGSRQELFEVEFTGDTDAIRRENFLTLVPVDAEVEMLAQEVTDAAGKYVASMGPPLRKITSPLSAGCRGCDYRATQPRQPDGFRECWGRFADVEPHLLDLFHIGKVGGRGGPLAAKLIRERKMSLLDVPRSSLVKADGSVGEVNRRQLIQIDHTLDNSEWISEELPDLLRSFCYPLHFIHFETTALCVRRIWQWRPTGDRWPDQKLTLPDTDSVRLRG